MRISLSVVGSCHSMQRYISIIFITTSCYGLVNQIAWAVDECAAEAVGADTLNCAGGNYAAGITYTNSDGLTLNLDDPTITSTPAAGEGVEITSSAINTNNIVINANNLTSITAGSAGHGILANNTGVGGDASIALANGAISSPGNALYALVSNAVGTGSTIISITGGTASTAGGGDIGAYARNDGLGAASVNMSDGGVTTLGIFASGIFAHIANTANTANATATFSGGSIQTSGGGVDSNAVYSRNEGLGSASVVISGGSINAVGRGGWARIDNAANTSSATVSMTGGTVTASNIVGISSFTAGLGDTETTLDGGVITTTGDNTYGVYSQINNNASTASASVSLNSGSVSTTGAAAHGLYGRHSGTGLTTVISASTVSTSGANADGVRAESSGGGNYDINITSGIITSGSGRAAGVHVISAGGGTIDVDASATIDGSASSIAFRDGDTDNDGVDEDGGNVVITSAGTVTGDAILGLGNDIFNLIGGTNTGDIYGDDIAASAGDGDDRFNWSGGDLNSGFFGGNGSDTAILSGSSNYEGNETLDGGDDYGSADGWIDTLTLRNKTVTVGTGTVINWENIVIDGGSVNFGATLEVSGELGLGLTINNEGIVLANTDFNLTGNLINNSIASTQNNAANNTFTVDGNYSGSGRLIIDTVLNGDNSATDQFIITGDSSGTATLAVNVLGGNGGQTSNGIQVVRVDGNSNAALTLDGDYVTANGNQAIVRGAFAYTLSQKANGHWYLQSNDGVANASASTDILYQPASAIYESYSQSLQQLNTLPKMEERLRQRYKKGRTTPKNTCVELSIPNDDQLQDVECLTTNDMSWARVQTSRHHVEPKHSTTETQSDISQWTFETGLDYLIYESDAGRFFISPTLHYGISGTDIESRFGNGSLDTTDYGVGFIATWFASNGFYVDGQMRYSWYNTDLASDTLGLLKTNNHGTGYALGVEMGQRMTINDNLTLTPQLQLVNSTVNIDNFSGPNEEFVIPDNSDILKTRIGASFEQDFKTLSERGKINRSHRYIIGNIYHDSSDDNNIGVSGTELTSETDAFSIEFGVGQRYTWNEGKYAASFDLSALSSLENFGESYSYQGSAHFSMRY